MCKCWLTPLTQAIWSKPGQLSSGNNSVPPSRLPEDRMVVRSNVYLRRGGGGMAIVGLWSSRKKGRSYLPKQIGNFHLEEDW